MLTGATDIVFWLRETNVGSTAQGTLLKVFGVIIAVLLAGYIAFCWLLYAKQNQLLYPGTDNANPAGFNALSIQSGEATLKVWALHTDKSPALLYFGGNGEDLGADLA